MAVRIRAHKDADAAIYASTSIHDVYAKKLIKIFRRFKSFLFCLSGSKKLLTQN